MGKFGLAALVVIVLCVHFAAAYTENLYLKESSVLNRTVNPAVGPTLEASVATTTNNNYSLGSWTSPELWHSFSTTYTSAAFIVYANTSYSLPFQTHKVWANITIYYANGTARTSVDCYINAPTITSASPALQKTCAFSSFTVNAGEYVVMTPYVEKTSAPVNNDAATDKLFYRSQAFNTEFNGTYTECGYSGTDGWTVSSNTTCTNHTINVGGSLAFGGAVGNHRLDLINTTLNFTTPPVPANGSYSISVGANNYLNVTDIDGKAETTADASNITTGNFANRLKFYVNGGVFTMSNSHVSGVGYAEGADYTTNGLVVESQYANITNSTITQSEYGLYLVYGNYTNVTLTNITSVSSAALYAENSTNVGASFNKLIGAGYGAYLTRATNSNLTNNNMSYAAYGAYMTGSASGNLVAFNNFSNASVHGLFVDAMSGGGAVGTTPSNFSYNNASYCAQNGIYVNESDGYANVQGNTVRGNGGNGIYLLESASNNVTGNTVAENAQTTCGEATGRAGIKLQGSATNNTIYGNTVWDNYYGIELYNGANGNNVSYNNVSYNENAGIYSWLGEADNCYQQNTVFNNTGSLAGMTLVSESNATLAGNNVSYNAKYGVYFDGTNNSIISATDSRNNAEGALYVGGGSWNNRFSDLTLEGAYGASYNDTYSKDYGSSTSFVNVTFNKSSIGWGACGGGQSDTCNLTLAWLTNANVTFSNGTGLGAATIEITDAFGSSVGTGKITTNSTGWMPPLNITEALFAGNDVAVPTTTNYTPHYFNASKAGYDYNGTNVSIDSNNKVVTIILYFCDHPASGAWSIATDQPTECRDQTIALLNGNVTMLSGSNLTLANVTFRFVSTVSPSPPHEFDIGKGALLITDLDGNPATTNDETNVSYAGGSVVFRVYGSASAVVRNSEFSNVGYSASFPYTEAGIWINASWANFTGNVVHHGYGGVYVVGANYTNVSENSITNGGGGDGMHLNAANVSYVADNNVSGYRYGAYAYNSSSNSTFANNNLSYNSLDGLRLGVSHSNAVYGNAMTNNTQNGAYIGYADNNTLTDNNASYNTQNGAHLLASNDTNCSYNNVSYNSLNGIYDGTDAILIGTQVSNNTLLLNNTVIGNGQSGILLSSGNNYYVNNSAAVYNLVSGNAQNGISFANVTLANVSYNTVNNHTDSAYYAIHAGYCDNLSALGNNASYNARAFHANYSGSGILSGSVFLYSTDYAVMLNASDNATVTDNRIGNSASASYGVYVLLSGNATVAGNNITAGIDSYGILLSGATYANASYNNASYCGYGFLVQDSANSTVMNGTALGNSKDGIRLVNASYANVSLSTASNNSNNGIYADASDWLNASYNDARYNDDGSYAGIYVAGSNNATVAYNNLLRNAIGLYAQTAGTANISYNNASYNGRQGIYLSTVVDAVLVGNNASYTAGSDADSAGLRVALSSTNASLSGNVAFFNTQDGIGVTDSDNVTLFNNNASNNTRYGIYESASSNGNVSYNNVSYNGADGLHFYPSADGVIAYANGSVAFNNASFNGRNGIRTDGWQNTTYLNNSAWNNTNAGMNVSNATGLHFNSNNASCNYGDGVLLYDVNATIYDNNTLGNNTGYGVVYVDSNVSSLNDSAVANNTLGKTLKAWSLLLTVYERTPTSQSLSTGALVNVTTVYFDGGIHDYSNYSSVLPNVTTTNGAAPQFILYNIKTNSTTDYNPHTMRIYKTGCSTYGTNALYASYKAAQTIVLSCAGGGGGGWEEPVPKPPAEKEEGPPIGGQPSPSPSPTATAEPTEEPSPTPAAEEENVLLCDESAQQLLQTLREILVYENPDGSRWTLVRITLFNKGKEAMDDMEIVETLPENVTLADVQFTDTPPTSTDNRTLTWEVGTLGAGKAVTVSYIIRKQVSAADFKAPGTRKTVKPPTVDWTQPLLAILGLETLLGAAYYLFVVSRKKKKPPIATAPARNPRATSGGRPPS